MAQLDVHVSLMIIRSVIVVVDDGSLRSLTVFHVPGHVELRYYGIFLHYELFLSRTAFVWNKVYRI